MFILTVNIFLKDARIKRQSQMKVKARVLCSKDQVSILAVSSSWNQTYAFGPFIAGLGLFMGFVKKKTNIQQHWNYLIPDMTGVWYLKEI